MKAGFLRTEFDRGLREELTAAPRPITLQQPRHLP
jgi:hypothetical protein